MKESDHFRWRDLVPMLEKAGMHNEIKEVKEMEQLIYDLVSRRRDKMNELLEGIKVNHFSGIEKYNFRPCHLKRLNELKVSSDFFMD